MKNGLERNKWPQSNLWGKQTPVPFSRIILVACALGDAG